MDSRTVRRERLRALKGVIESRATVARDETYGWKVGADGHGRQRVTWTIDRDPFVALMALTALRNELLSEIEDELVTRCRAHGIAWQEIGWALGLTDRGAKSRHNAVDLAVAGIVAEWQQERR